ncbi:MAG: hypothetical protein IJ689_02015 [Alphaproteobacteria bacterium]|nr:hypothetical protein [Alphaproteobacteria bacterium]
MLYNKNVDVDNPNDSQSIICNMIEPQSTVLDMGCACGDLALRLAKLKNCIVYGLEYNPQSVKKCLAKNVFAEVKHKRQYIILSLFILPYVDIILSIKQ